MTESSLILIAEKHLGHPGRCLPFTQWETMCIKDARIVTTDGQPLWIGDLDLSMQRDGAKLSVLARDLGQMIVVMRPDDKRPADGYAAWSSAGNRMTPVTLPAIYA